MQVCFERGQWKDKMTMCRAENRAFERCYSMQTVRLTLLIAGVVCLGWWMIDDC